MAHRLTVWRAAQLLGVSRGQLQTLVREGRLALDDGLVSSEHLLALFPQAHLEDSGMLERTQTIRNEAFARRVRERTLPSQEVLAQRLFHQSTELAEVRRHLQRYHGLVTGLRDRLRAASTWPGPQALADDIDRALGQVLASEAADPLEAMDDMLKLMSAQVTIRPSGHEFSVLGHDTLLQAGLKAGLRLPYGCGNGSCGMCKVRVIQGQVCRTQPFDYVLSETEKAQGYTLMCAHTAASSDLTLETLEAAGPQDIPAQDLVATLRSVTMLGPDTALLHLQTPRSHRLRFLAGQSVTLGLAGASGDLQATLPIASCPCDDRNLHFLVAREQDGDFGMAVCAGLKSGTAVSVRGPMGDFVLAEGLRPLLFIACDTAFAPIKSLIEHALALEAAPAMALLWLATRPDGHVLANQCRAWSEALDAFEYTPITDRDVQSGANQVVESLRADLFAIDCDCYVAGPELFVRVVDSALAAMGVPAAQRRCQVLP